MSKRPALQAAAPDLTARERMLLFCVASGTDWQRAGITGDTVTALVAKGLIERNSGGRLSLTESGRETLRTLLPQL